MQAVRRPLAGLLSKSPNDVVLLSAARSPITRAFKGGFKDAYPEEILGPVMREAVRRAGIEFGDVNDVIIGNVLSELGFAKTGRMALNHYGFPNSTTFGTVNRQCSSSLQAITNIANSIRVGQIEIGLGGGVESMTRNYGSRGLPSDVSPLLRDSPVKASRDCLMPMGLTSENVAERYGISRRMQDEFALESHRRAESSQKNGIFDEEIVPITVRSFNKDSGIESEVTISLDDGIRSGLTLEKLGKLKPAFKDTGTSTAGNSSQISDGASSAILARREWAESRGLKPIGRFVASQVSGCEPDEMGISPIFAIPALMARTGISIQDIDILELNEAFASQAIYCIQQLGIHAEKVNPKGGAIALGHPTGATGARQTATLLAELIRQDKEIGVVSMCASTGMGVASLFIRE